MKTKEAKEMTNQELINAANKLNEECSNSSESNAKELFKQGMQMINLQYSLSKAIAIADDTRSELIGRMTVIRSDVFSEVSQQIGINAKPVFSNEAARNAETDIRLSQKKEYVELDQTVKSLNQYIKELQLHKETSHSRLSLYRAYFRALSNE